VIFQTEVGDTYAVDGPPGITVMRLAVSHGVPGIEGECGGVLTCATCHVHVDPAWHDRLPPPGNRRRRCSSTPARDAQPVG